MQYFTFERLIILVLALFGTISLGWMQNALTPPGGVVVIPGANETYTPPIYYYNASFTTGGYTQLTPGQIQQSEIWQGFYGNISAVVSLANSAGQTFYNWSVLNVSGMVYASTDENPS